MVLKAVRNIDVLAPDESAACSTMASLATESALMLTMYLRREPALLAHASRLRLCVFADQGPFVPPLLKSSPTDVVYVRVDEPLLNLPADARRTRLFYVLADHLRLLVSKRGWDGTPLEAAIADCEGDGLRFHWRGPWVANRSKTAEARAHFFVDEQGEARGELELRQPDGPDFTSDSHRALYFLDGFPRAAKTLRWEGPAVTFRPFADRFNLDTKRVGLQLQT